MHDRTLELILVPFDVERADTGAARGPHGLLERGFATRLRKLGATVHVSEIALRDGAGARGEEARAACVVELGRGVAREIAIAHSRRRFPLVVAGGCLPAIGAVTGLQRSGRELQVVWIDAHGDFNTPESTPSGYWDGMALAAVCGRSLPEVFEAIELRPIHFRSVMHLAGRAFDPPEIEDIRRLNLDVVPPREVAAEETRQRLERHLQGRQDLYLHVDVDGIDPADAPAVNFPEPAGAKLGDLLRLLQWIARLRPPAAMTLGSLNFERADAAGAERTVEACVALVEPFLRPAGSIDLGPSAAP
jgi:arginase